MLYLCIFVDVFISVESICYFLLLSISISLPSLSFRISSSNGYYNYYSLLTYFNYFSIQFFKKVFFSPRHSYLGLQILLLFAGICLYLVWLYFRQLFSSWLLIKCLDEQWWLWFHFLPYLSVFHVPKIINLYIWCCPFPFVPSVLLGQVFDFLVSSDFFQMTMN